jgi:hypothetical protein
MHTLNHNYHWPLNTDHQIRQTTQINIGQHVEFDYFREATQSKHYSGIVQRVVNKENGDLLTIKTDRGFRSFHADLITNIV